MFLVFQMTIGTLPVPRLLVGDFEAAQDSEWFPEISAVLCVARGCEAESKIGQANYLHVDLLDDGQDELLPHIDACMKFIEQQTKDGGCLVHCMHGMSRSVAVCTAYLMKTEKLGFGAAYEKIKASYPKAAISESFVKELERFGNEFAWDMSMDAQV